jgi:hypothetical protein
LVHQGYDEFVLGFVKCFREIKSQCFHLIISKRDLTDLAFAGLRSCIKEKHEHYVFLHVNQLLQKAVVVEARLKESCDISRSQQLNMHVIQSYSDSSDNENEEC